MMPSYIGNTSRLIHDLDQLVSYGELPFFVSGGGAMMLQINQCSRTSCDRDIISKRGSGTKARSIDSDS